MLANALATLTKLDYSKVGASDVARIAAIFRDSAQFDAVSATRRGRRLARRAGGYVAARPKQAGLGLGGAMLLGLAGYAAYRMATAKPNPLGDGELQDERASVTNSVSEPA